MSAHCIFILLLSCIFSVHTFNFDNKTFVKHYHQEPGSMFGFTVAQYLDKNTGSILVGAPRAKTIQPSIYKGGYVFKCPIDQHDSCVPQYFDTRGDEYSAIRKENKSEQFFGGTLSASSDGVVVACAPLYRIIQENNASDDGSFPVGICYIASNSFTNISPFSPCIDRPSDACQTGFASSISKDGTSLYLGAPGTLGFQGQLFSKALNSRVLLDTSLSEDAGSDFNSYLGYSVTAVDFKGQKEVAVGMPRGGHPMGKVLLYTWDLNNYQNITGEQIGAYFGYSLTSGDIDGNGFDDLIIGAPLYTDPVNPDIYERGRVYVIYRDESELKFQRADRLDGKMTKARFGLSVTALGDIDRDGFGDFAVGAPYDGPKGHGIVYIYRGGPSGVRTVPSQIIQPEYFGSYPPITTFGFSLSGGMDLDRNQYPDLLIGAYNSNTVILVKSRPVVKVKARVTLQSKVLSLQDANCALANGDKVVCSSFRYCLTYSGVNVDRETAFNLRFALDSKSRIQRMFSKETEGLSFFNRVINLSQNKEHCDDVGVYFMANMSDQLSASPMDVEMWYSLDAENEYRYQERNPRAVPSQMMDQNSKNVARNAINIMRDCGPDKICVPDLQLSVYSNTNTYYLGSNKDISFEVLIKNEGEDAFETQYSLKMPPGVNYVKVERLNELPTDVRIHCSAPSAFNNFILTCDLGNPMPAGETINFKVYLRPHKINGMTQSYEFPMEVTSANDELANTANDNRHNLFIKILVQTDLSLNGKSEPSDLQYNATMQIIEKNVTTETDIGPQILHIYSLSNNGSSNIEQVEIDVVWPYQTLEGDDFMYLLEQPEITRNLRCDPAQYVNYRNVELNLSTRTKSYLPWIYNAEESEQSSVLSLSSIFDDNIDDPSYNYYSGSANRGDVLDHVTKPTKEKKIPIYRRDVSQVTDDLHEFLETSSLCQKFRCARMHCESSTLNRNQEIWISLRARVNENALLKISSDVLQVASKLAARVTRVPYIGQPVDTKIYTYSVGTNIIRPLEPAGVPLWIIILAIIAGVVLLSLLVYWFYKCGFFNRNRPTAETPEAQPMNV